MSKKTEKALNEKLNVKLPENLSKERLLEQLDNIQQNEKIIEIPKKKNTAKKLVPIAASLALVVGLLGIYFGAGLGDKIKTEDPQSADKTEVMRYQSYDKIYEKFDALRKEYKDNNGNFLVDLFGGVYNTSSDDAMAENMAGDMSSGSSSADSDMMPESSNENFLSGTGENTATSGSPSTETTDKKEHGTTNTQEEGVDEGDIIKTDGNYLYIANANSEIVSIIDVTGEEMKIASQIDVETDEHVLEIYINGDKLIVLGNLYESYETHDTVHSVNGNVVYKEYARYGERGNSTFVKVYDVTNRTAPKLVTEYTQQGGYDNSRMIGTKLYTISTYYVDIRNDNYRDKCIPETVVNGVCERIPAGCISVVEESNSNVYAVITTLDIENSTEPTSEAILGDCDELYASAKGLFISENDYYSENYHAYQQTTKIYRFEYTDTGVNYKCMGRVDGYINDQFSMSYDGEHFRIATTVNKYVTYDANGNATEVQLFDEDGKRNKDLGDVAVSNVTMNNLYILNNNMQIVGKVEDMAQGETIKSVRFVGNMAYVVTFRQTDPLFVIDLSNPENPTVKGELKIPGFSEYLHPIADGLLVGVGYDGTEFGTNGDCKVSLFDVTNPYEPKESSVLTVSGGKADCYPSVAENHKLYIELSEDEFAVPFIVYSYVQSGDYLRNKTHLCYIRYRLSDNALCEVARYNIEDSASRVFGATYVENTFYIVVNEQEYYNKNDTYVVAFDLTTNEELGRIALDN